LLCSGLDIYRRSCIRDNAIFQNDNRT